MEFGKQPKNKITGVPANNGILKPEFNNLANAASSVNQSGNNDSVTSLPSAGAFDYTAPTPTQTNFNAANTGSTDFTATDLSTGIYGATRLSTQEDVNSGLATAVGQQIGNTVSLPQAEGAVLGEVLKDGDTAYDMKIGAIDDKYANLTGAADELANSRIDVLNEQNEDAVTATNTLIDASDTKFNSIEAASDSLTDAAQASSTETFDNTKAAKDLLDAENVAGKIGIDNAANSATNIATSAAQGQFDKTEAASAALSQAEYDANRAKYQNVTDALRADRLGAMRRGESTTTGTGDRMRLEAEMNAAREYSNLDNASRVAEANRTLANTSKLGQQETDATTNILAKNTLESADEFNKQSMSNVNLLANATIMNNQSKHITDQAQRTLQNTAANQSEVAEAKKILADTQYASNVAKANLVSKQEVFSFLREREEESIAAADELANITQSTQEQTLPAVKLAELIIEQAIDEGNLEVETAEERYEAKIEKAKELLSNPSLMQVMAEEMDGNLLRLGAEYDSTQQMFLNRINNLKNIPGLVDTIINSVSDSVFAQYEAEYGEYGAIWLAGFEMGHVDADGKVIPKNTYAEKTVGSSTEAAASEAANIPGGDSEPPVSADVTFKDGTLGVDIDACWVAREVYGINNPAWMAFRFWMLNKSPSWFKATYLRYGERFARFISDKPRLKSLIRTWMDSKIGG